jgi:hypothetical protein
VPGHNQQRRIDCKLNSRQQNAMSYLAAGLTAEGATTRVSNQVVNSISLAVHWMADRLVEIVEKAEQDHQPAMKAYGEAVEQFEAECERILSGASKKEE